MIKKYVLLATLVITGFFAGYSTIAHAVYGRSDRYGYFYNQYDDSGNFVMPDQSGTFSCESARWFERDSRGNHISGDSIPASVNSADTFIAFIKCKLNSTNKSTRFTPFGTVGGQERTGAAFIIQSMIGNDTTKPPTAAQIADWESRVRAQEAAALSGTSKASVSWHFNYRYAINTYYQNGYNSQARDDDAFYATDETSDSIIFRDTNGFAVYGIRRACGNPVGSNGAFTKLPPSIWSTSGRTTVAPFPGGPQQTADLRVTPGQTIQFNHYVKNNGPDATSKDIYWATIDTINNVSPGNGNSLKYALNQEKNVSIENYTVSPTAKQGDKICRKVGWDPVTSGGIRDGRGTEVCAVVNIPVYGLVPTIGVSEPNAEIGDTLIFTYIVRNNGPDSVPNPSCSSPVVCANPFPASTTTVKENVPVTAADRDKQICRSLTVSPTSAAGGTQTVTACARVVSKPFFSVNGGDIAAGNGFRAGSSGACTSNNSAQITSWNKQNASYDGAGAQFAAFALANLFDFASAKSIGGVAPPTGLSFANTSASVPTHVYGGQFGSASCIADYYSQLPSGSTTLNAALNPATASSGTYSGSAQQNVDGGVLLPGKVIKLYVNGDVQIKGNIVYQDGFTIGNVPVFELIVKGNIYIEKNVTRLDGFYIAQPKADGTGGNIYTCSTGASTIPSLNTISNLCNTPLTVNGSLIAQSLDLRKTFGTLSQNVPAETVNYGPAFWIPQPFGGTVRSYDSTTSLPPVL